MCLEKGCRSALAWALLYLLSLEALGACVAMVTVEELMGWNSSQDWRWDGSSSFTV